MYTADQAKVLATELGELIDLPGDAATVFLGGDWAMRDSCDVYGRTTGTADVNFVLSWLSKTGGYDKKKGDETDYLKFTETLFELPKTEQQLRLIEFTELDDEFDEPIIEYQVVSRETLKELMQALNSAAEYAATITE